jgi:hypothetical protein
MLQLQIRYKIRWKTWTFLEKAFLSSGRRAFPGNVDVQLMYFQAVVSLLHSNRLLSWLLYWHRPFKNEMIWIFTVALWYHNDTISNGIVMRRNTNLYRKYNYLNNINRSSTFRTKALYGKLVYRGSRYMHDISHYKSDNLKFLFRFNWTHLWYVIFRWDSTKKREIASRSPSNTCTYCTCIRAIRIN